MAIKADTSFSLADQLFNAASVKTLADALANAWPQFNAADFSRLSLSAFPELELKQRINHMVDQLDLQLPEDFDQAVDILDAALPAPLNPDLTDDDFGEFIWAVPAEWVALNGCTEPRLDRSLKFLKQATMRFSVESAIRPFLRTPTPRQRCALSIVAPPIPTIMSGGSPPKVSVLTCPGRRESGYPPIASSKF